jgi:hypothetical protein
MSIGGAYGITGTMEKAVLMGEEVYVVDIKVHQAGVKVEDCAQCAGRETPHHHKPHDAMPTASRTLSGNTGIQRRLVPRSTF